MADTLTITDNRTGKQYEVPITDGTVKAMDLRKIKTGDDDFGLTTYDPAFMNTASCRSKITYIDGDKGILMYRGYPIEQLAEKSTYLETAYLLLHGELPTAPQLASWTKEITMHTMVHENIKKFMEGFTYDAHPMSVFVSTVGAMSTFYPDGKDIFNADSRRKQIIRLRLDGQAREGGTGRERHRVNSLDGAAFSVVIALPPHDRPRGGPARPRDRPKRAG